MKKTDICLFLEFKICPMRAQARHYGTYIIEIKLNKFIILLTIRK